ncbi:MAG: hypothetical protein H0V35_12215 [Nitrospira sp.]|nr:hypothetical protein [Nitrospira sp.]
MAKHDVSFNIPQRSLGKADVEFLVKRDNIVLGTLAISDGSIVWFPKLQRMVSRWAGRNLTRCCKRGLPGSRSGSHTLPFDFSFAPDVIR